MNMPLDFLPIIVYPSGGLRVLIILYGVYNGYNVNPSSVLILKRVKLRPFIETVFFKFSLPK